MGDKWILHNLNNTIKDVNHWFDKYEFSNATESFRAFWLDNFCDIYLEHSKLVLVEGQSAEVTNKTKAILFKVIETGMRLLHPMMPFISEELYQKLPKFDNKFETICLATYPESNEAHNFPESSSLNDILKVLTCIRQMMASVTLPPKTAPKIFMFVSADDAQKIKKEEYKEFFPFLAMLSKCGEISWVETEGQIPEGCLVSVINNIKVNMDIKEFIKVEDEVNFFS